MGTDTGEPTGMGGRTTDTSPFKLRFGLLGYRRADVASALASLRSQLDGLAASVDRLYREREELRARLEQADAARERVLAEQAARLGRDAAGRRELAAAQGEQHLAEARAQAAQLLAEAEEQAAKLRHEAGLRVGDAASRLEDLLLVREQLLGELRGLLRSYSELIGEHDAGPLERSARQVEPAQPALAAAAPPAGAGGLFPTRVELDAGPFGDFAELSAFERALARLPKVEDVYIRGFGDERAVIELSLTEQTPLAHDLTTRLPYGLKLERNEDARLHVELLPEAAAGS